MAVLYIDRLKSNFQQTDRPLPRAHAKENWFPKFFVKCLANDSDKECHTCLQAQTRNGCTSFRVSKAPKICAIGLRPNKMNANQSPFWSIVEMKKLLQQYLNIIRRYRSYFYISWKPGSNESCEWRAFSFTSFLSIISKCSKKFTKRECFSNKDRSSRRHEQQRRSPEMYNFESSLKNSYKLNRTDRRYPDNNRNHEVVKKDTDSDTPRTSVSPRKDDNSPASNFMEESLANCTVLTVESSDSAIFGPNNYSARKSKKNVYVQTSRRHRSRKKFNEDLGSSEKENFMLPTGTSSSKDVKTIFKVNDADFHDRKSKTNFSPLKIRQKSKKESSKPRRPRKSKDQATESPNLNSTKAPNENNESSHLGKPSKAKRSRNTDRFQNKVKKKYQTTLFSKTSDTESSKSMNPKSPILSRTSKSYSARNYLIEDKISEIMILGKVKKRLEEDYDEYFSVNEIDIENDLVEAPRKVSCSNQCSATSSETRIDQHMSQEGLRTSRSVLTVAKYQESRNRVWQSTLNSTEHEEPKSRSIKAGRTRTSSSRYSNLDLVRSQSSYYQSMRDDECTPSSSVEYCTASSISLTKFQSIIDNSLDTAHQTCSVDTDASCDCSFDASLDQAFLSNDMTFEENAISQNGGEFLDETVVNCFTVCCCPRNSTPNFSKSSRRVTESLDSGILTDCSRDCFRASEEYLKEKRKDLGKRRCGERKMDLLPTYDFNTDSSYSDDSLNRRVDVAVRKFTENLILTERKVKIKLRRLQNLPRHRQERKRWKTGRQVKKLSESSSKYSSTYQFDFPQWQTDDDRFLSSSTPPVFSFSDSEIDHL